jgi:archaeal flagellar protein FlaI
VTTAESVATTPHLQAYLDRYRSETGRTPLLLDKLDATMDLKPPFDLIYPVGEPIFVHIAPAERGYKYIAIEPELRPEEDVLLSEIRDRIFQQALYRPPPKHREDLEGEIVSLFDVVTSAAAKGVAVAPDRVAVLKYYLLRNIARFGPLEPFARDPYLEDIQAVGTAPVHVIHKFFDMLPTNVQFPDLERLDAFVRNLSERIGRPVSDARPIVDWTLPDGSRINIIYSEDVSRKGPSFSIRRVHEEPISITQLIAWKTISAEIAAYVWLCLENAMSIFVCGESACGKSATLNAFLGFINPRSKLYTAEDTPEVRPPHPVWQRLITRETGPEEARVKMFDLLKAALRSRPNYIVVGEIRGAEGAVAFQAMQTGHPTVATFHASDKTKMIQRLGASPINIPQTFMDNLNVAVFQQALYQDGRLIRRVTSIDEIEGYSEFDGGVITRPVFSYDPNSDTHTFRGNNNSYILERKIAEQHGYEDPQQIYRELQERAAVLRTLVERRIFRNEEVNKLLFAFADHGVKALPFEVPHGVTH